MPVSKRGSLSIGKESTWGTAVVGSTFINATEGINTTRAQLRDGMQYQTLGPAVATPGRVTAAGSINDHQVRLNDIGVELRAALGAPTTTGSNPYTHVYARSITAFADGVALPPYSVTRVLRTDLIERFAGGQCTRLTFTQADGEALMASSEWVFKSVAETTAPTYAAPTGTVLKYKDLAITRDGTAVTDCFQSVTITIDNALDAVSCLNGTDTISNVEFGDNSRVTLSATALFNTTQQYDDFVASTATDTIFTWTSGASSLKFEFHRLQYEDAGFTANLGGGRILANISAVAEYSSSDSTDFTATLINSTATY